MEVRVWRVGVLVLELEGKFGMSRLRCGWVLDFVRFNSRRASRIISKIVLIAFNVEIEPPQYPGT